MLLDEFVHLRQVAFECRTDAAESQGHFLHLVVDVVGVLVTDFAMVLEGDVLGVLLDLVRAKVLQFARVEIVDAKVLRVAF